MFQNKSHLFRYEKPTTKGQGSHFMGGTNVYKVVLENCSHVRSVLQVPGLQEKPQEIGDTSERGTHTDLQVLQAKSDGNEFLGVGFLALKQKKYKE